MRKVPEVIPITDLLRDAAVVLKRLRKGKEPIVITQRGIAAAVLLSIEEYERARQEREILELLVRGDKEIAIGDGHELEDVMAEADSIVAEDEA